MGTEHFDAKAADWDSDEQKVAQARAVARAVAAAVPLGRSTRLLEYGAGTGLVTQALADRVGALTVADSSAGMREALQGKVRAGTLPGARVWDLDLQTAAAPDERFDLVVLSFVLHHVHDLDRVLGRLAGLLDPGGCLCIADLDSEAGTFHQHASDVHPGFDRAQLAEQLSAAGLVSVSVQDCTAIVRDGVTYPVFLAVARRP